MRLRQVERTRIFAGDYAPLTREEEPDFEVGASCVLSWSRRQRSHDRGQVFDVPRRPLFWITVTRIMRKRRGGWSVAFEAHDHRDRPLYLASGMAVGHVGADDEESDQPISAEAEHGYTRRVDRGLVGAGEVLDPFTQERIAKEARVAKRRRMAGLQREVAQIRESIERLESDPEAKDAGREIYLLKGRLEALERKLGRQAA